MPPPPPANTRGILVTDFDGTITNGDFFELVRARWPQVPDPWDQALAGVIPMREALRRIFAGAQGTQEEFLALCEIPPDQDGDGLPDWWEELNFGSAEDGLPHLDDDGDGQCNLDEWISGSCPTNAASCFAASNQTYQPGAGLVISWPSFSNRIYQLESATTLTGLFSTLATQLPATPPLNVYTDAVPHAGAGQFYKIRVQLEE